MGFWRRMSRRVKSVVRSPITKSIAGGLAVAFPVVGVPAVAAIATADRALKAADDPQVKAVLKVRLNTTRKAAAMGDPAARRALGAFTTVVQAKRGDPAAQARLFAIQYRHSIGQRVRARTRLLSNGRIAQRF